MTQRRIKDYGTLAEASDLKDLAFGLSRSTVLQGCRLSVAGTDKIRVYPGIAVTDKGIVIIEDEQIEIEVPSTTNAQDYTVYYKHVYEEISGGSPADLLLEKGLLNPDDISGVVIGYIQYPGQAVPMSSAYFKQEPEIFLKNYLPDRNNVEWLIPIKGAGYLITSTSGSALTITDYWDPTNLKYGLKIQNNVVGSALASATFTFPFKVSSFPFALLQAKMQVDLGATVDFKLIDSSGDLIDITANPLQAQSDFFLYSLSIPPESVQDTNNLVYLQMIINLSTTRKIQIQGLGLSSYNLPL